MADPDRLDSLLDDPALLVDAHVGEDGAEGGAHGLDGGADEAGEDLEKGET